MGSNRNHTKVQATATSAARRLVSVAGKLHPKAPARDDGGDGRDSSTRKPVRTRTTAAATTAVKAATKKAAVHAASKNPYVVAVIAVVLVVVVALFGLFIWVGVGNASPNPLALQIAHSQIGAGATADIPPVVLAAYVSAAGQASMFNDSCVLRPSILAGIGWRESIHGTYRGSSADAAGDVSPAIIGIPLDGTGGTATIFDSDNGMWDGDTVWDRAVGPMQFLPGTWNQVGQDGNSDGVANPHNIFDAALAAAAYLCVVSPVDLNASDEALRAALFAYNRSTEYVDAVMARIAFYDIALAGSGFSPDASMLLANPQFEACPGAVDDLTSGEIDVRAISVMSAIVQTHSIYVCPLKTGHYQCVGGGSLVEDPFCTESHHWHGRGVDIIVVDGGPVSRANGGAYAIVEWLATFPASDPIRPGVGSPWPEFSALSGFFNDSAHNDHIHLSFCGPRWSHGVWSDTCD